MYILIMFVGILFVLVLIFHISLDFIPFVLLTHTTHMHATLTTVVRYNSSHFIKINRVGQN